MPRTVLAVDQSTSATKAVLFGEDGRLIGRASEEHKQYYPGAGMIEHDPEELLANTLAVIGRVVRETATDPRSIAALAITNQRETIAVWDARTGRPLHHALIWQDQRGTAACEELKARGLEPSIRSKTGLVVDTYFSASKLKWLVDNVPSVREAAARGEALCGTIDSWLVYKLTGGRVHATDYSNACRTMLFDVRTLEWDKEILQLFGVGSLRFPQVRFGDASFGEAVLADPRVTLPITGVLGDSHAALFGHCGFDAGDAKATFGTGTSVMLNIGPAPVDPPQGIVLSLAWGLGGRVDYVFEGNIHSSADTLKWLRDQVNLFDDYDEMEKAAASVPDNGGVYLVPAFAGLGAPYWAHGVRALITGLERSSSRAHILRAACESIGYQINDLLTEMRRDQRISVATLRVDGGATRNRFLMQLQADLVATGLRVADIEDVSARGAAFAAGLATGVWRDRGHLASLSKERALYTPRMPQPERVRLLAGWKSAVEQTLARRL
jgi:glycerol kinase